MLTFAMPHRGHVVIFHGSETITIRRSPKQFGLLYIAASSAVRIKGEPVHGARSILVRCYKQKRPIVIDHGGSTLRLYRGRERNLVIDATPDWVVRRAG